MGKLLKIKRAPKRAVYHPCWFCGSEIIWGGDNNYDEVYGEGEGIVANLQCSNPDCNAQISYSIRTDEVSCTQCENFNLDRILEPTCKHQNDCNIENHEEKILIAKRPYFEYSEAELKEA